MTFMDQIMSSSEDFLLHIKCAKNTMIINKDDFKTFFDVTSISLKDNPRYTAKVNDTVLVYHNYLKWQLCLVKSINGDMIDIELSTNSGIYETQIEKNKVAAILDNAAC